MKMTKRIFFLDTEVGVSDKKVHDIGAVSHDGRVLHTQDVQELVGFLANAEYVCGHNLIHHDLKYLRPSLYGRVRALPVDTLYWSPLLFPKKPYHALLKDDKIQVDELNNPVNDCQKAALLFEDEVNAFEALPDELKRIYFGLLHQQEEFLGLFRYMDYDPSPKGLMGFIRGTVLSGNELSVLIRSFFHGRLCEHAEIEQMIRNLPVELAYALSLIHTGDLLSIVPPWVVHQFPKVYNLINLLCGVSCQEGCDYCREKLDVHKALYRHFGYNQFRTFKGEALQEKAAQAAVDGKSILVVFPTGGGKSITFQLPALMAGDNSHGLTVVISPLQSLMKDQVDNLSERGITSAVTINGLLDPVERQDAFRRIEDGTATLLYIAPEMLRSKTVENMLLSRNVVRFVVDEAHCFSAWGQDFRIDYQYIGDFITKLQKNKKSGEPIAVSCFTATAKQKVISDIRDYFKKKLNLDLEVFATDSVRENLHYTVLYKETEDEKYVALRELIEAKDCPTIVYVSRTRRAEELARKLSSDGFEARPFHGKMPAKEKIENQEAFIRNEVQIIVATSAFGMGVDKKDIGLVIHYDISDSLENYMQESGRAGRDVHLQAECFVLYNDTDLDQHFILLNQTKLSISEIQQIWTAIKQMTGTRRGLCSSPLEIARRAGWDQSVPDLETRVKTAVAALENAGYIERGNNMPRVYATGIMVRNMDEAVERLDQSPLFNDDQRMKAKRIIKSLISKRSIAQAGVEDAESRVDYLADILGIPKSEVVELIGLMRQEGLLADSMDMAAYILKEDTQRRSSLLLEHFAQLEKFLIDRYDEAGATFNLKELNQEAERLEIPQVNIKNIHTVLYYHTIKSYIDKAESVGSFCVRIVPKMKKSLLLEKYELRLDICRFIVKDFYEKAAGRRSGPGEEQLVEFSLLSLFQSYAGQSLFQVTQQDVEDALLYLSKIGALRLEGGFLVFYSALQIKRVEMDNRIRYKLEDYAALNDFYRQKIQQVHIVGTFANMMVKDYNAALGFVNDYFQMDCRKFINRYFKGEAAANLNRNMTSERYRKLFGVLSENQLRIIQDDESKNIVVVAGPGSGKTRVLVHKLAAILTLEDVKHEQLLMLTFSRAAATEFKSRLIDLIKETANFVEIKTFHSYCFDLLGKIGNLEEVDNVVRNAAQMILAGEVEPDRIAKRVLVIDEAQDMDEDEYHLVQALMNVNEDMKVIAVGDDDQNIYEFRGSDSKYLRALVNEYDARLYELVENYRSCQKIVRFSNLFARQISNRLKNREIVAVSKEEGSVTLYSHRSSNMEEAVVENLTLHPTDGTSCIMTTTNDQAFYMLGLLLKKGIQARLIQSNDGFSLYDLAEIRFFIKKLPDKNLYTEEEWKTAKEALSAVYAHSACLENCLTLLSQFEKVNERLYRSDFEEFVRESHYEDFVSEEAGTVFVSTIHKTKGREFNQVFMLLKNFNPIRDEEKRTLYVGITRAKEALFVHYDNGLFDWVKEPGIQKYLVRRIYPAPDEICMQLTHRDVFLDFFKNKKKEILHLQSGMPLGVEEGGLFIEKEGRRWPVLRYSKSCAAKLEHLREQGFRITGARVRFILAWKGEGDVQETAVLLPDIQLRKFSQDPSDNN